MTFIKNIISYFSKKSLKPTVTVLSTNSETATVSASGCHCSN